MSAAPRVSVCIPTRNHAAYLGRALRSALAQDVDGLELLVHDDASDDETAALVASFSDDRVRYVRHATPVGIAANRSSCLAVARGQYIAWLDADDERLPGTLSPQLELLDSERHVVLVHGANELVDLDGRELPDWPRPFDRDEIEPSQQAFGQLIASNEITTSTVVVRRAAYRDRWPAVPAAGASSSDWEMWLLLSLRGAIAYAARRTARYRQHPDSISRATSAGGERLRCNVALVERVLRRERSRIAEPDRLRAVARAALAAQALLQAGDAYTRGARPEALDALAVARRFGPWIGELRALRAATIGGDDAACMTLTRAALRELSAALSGTRFGAKLAAAAVGDDQWDAQLKRAGTVAGRITPAAAVIAAIAKWDPTVLANARRPGCNYPDRELHPDGYPRDGAAAVAHLEALRSRRGITHLVVPGFSGWWLEHYPELARRLGQPVWQDGDCSIYEVGPR